MKVLHFEDRGQDFTWWRIDENGVVTDCGPFQSRTWVGLKVQPQTVKLRQRPVVFGRAGAVRELNYRIVRIDAFTDNDCVVLQHALQPGLVRSRRGHWVRRDHAGPWYRAATIDRLEQLGIVAPTTGKAGETLVLTQLGVDQMAARAGRAA